VFGFLAHLDFGVLGFVIVAAFAVTWVVAFAVFKVRRVEERWSELVAGE
jgi:high-affinity nickel-transport protein